MLLFKTILNVHLISYSKQEYATINIHTKTDKKIASPRGV